MCRMTEGVCKQLYDWMQCRMQGVAAYIKASKEEQRHV